MHTGEVLLAFARHELGQGNLPEGDRHHDPVALLQATELAFVTEDVPAAVAAAGAHPLRDPTTKPW